VSELTDRLWDRFGALGIDELPGPVVTVAQQCVLDWIGCALAGSREPVVAILCDEFAGSSGPASLVGLDREVGVLSAALINGVAGHALDFDDSHLTMTGHPTAPVLPAVLAQAEADGCSGSDLLTGFVVGVEVELRIAAAIGPEHYARGWHQSSTIGVLGAAAAVARLRGFDKDGFERAMGLAASSSGGLKANFGTMAKPLHLGSAAERGLLAARLAGRGFTADAAAIDGPQGLVAAAGGGSLDLERLDAVDHEWLITETLFKYHAACFLAHAGIEATRSLLADGVDPSRIERIRLTVNPQLLDVCSIPDPRTGLEAKFSLAGTQALVLSGVDTSAVAAFEDGPINGPDVRAFLGRVVVDVDDSLPPSATRVVVDLSGSAGEREAFHDTGVPASDLDDQGRRIRAKFEALAVPVIGTGAAASLADRVGDLRRLADLREVGSLVRGSGTSVEE
jgi:2-methylcitrate dehydratase PrpD